MLIPSKLIRKCKYPYASGCNGKKLAIYAETGPIPVPRFRYHETRSPTLSILPSYREDKRNPRRREGELQLHESNCSPLREFYEIRAVLPSHLVSSPEE